MRKVARGLDRPEQRKAPEGGEGKRKFNGLARSLGLGSRFGLSEQSAVIDKILPGRRGFGWEGRENGSPSSCHRANTSNEGENCVRGGENIIK